MQEAFLTAIVQDGDFEQARAVMQGLCAMNSWPSVHRVLFFQGIPPQPKGQGQTSKGPPVTKSAQTDTLWRVLNQYLSKQSYLVQLRYEVFKDKDFGGQQTEGHVADLNAVPGNLTWTDMPEPNNNNTPVLKRKKIEIHDQKNLINTLTNGENKHRFKTEAIEESHTYVRDGIQFTFVRYYTFPNGGAPAPVPVLPPWDSLQKQDPAGKWLFFVKAHVLEDNSNSFEKLEKLRKADEALMGVKEELAGVFDFKVLDRRVHDTRITQQTNNVPEVLPQTVRVGGGSR